MDRAFSRIFAHAGSNTIINKCNISNGQCPCWKPILQFIHSPNTQNLQPTNGTAWICIKVLIFYYKMSCWILLQNETKSILWDDQTFDRRVWDSLSRLQKMFSSLNANSISLVSKTVKWLLVSLLVSMVCWKSFNVLKHCTTTTLHVQRNLVVDRAGH